MPEDMAHPTVIRQWLQGRVTVAPVNPAAVVDAELAVSVEVLRNQRSYKAALDHSKGTGPNEGTHGDDRPIADPTALDLHAKRPARNVPTHVDDGPIVDPTALGQRAGGPSRNIPTYCKTALSPIRLPRHLSCPFRAPNHHHRQGLRPDTPEVPRRRKAYRDGPCTSSRLTIPRRPLR